MLIVYIHVLWIRTIEDNTSKISVVRAIFDQETKDEILKKKKDQTWNPGYLAFIVNDKVTDEG